MREYLILLIKFVVILRTTRCVVPRSKRLRLTLRLGAAHQFRGVAKGEFYVIQSFELFGTCQR